MHTGTWNWKSDVHLYLHSTELIGYLHGKKRTSIYKIMLDTSYTVNKNIYYLYII